VVNQKASDFSIGEGPYVLDLVEAELLIFSEVIDLEAEGKPPVISSSPGIGQPGYQRL
jgi:hypothetical protein